MDLKDYKIPIIAGVSSILAGLIVNAIPQIRNLMVNEALGYLTAFMAPALIAYGILKIWKK